MTLKNLIIGAGPAGFTAAIYSARANLSPLLLTGTQPGGQLTTTNEVENFPGYPEGVSGPLLMEDLQKQAERFGTTVVYATTTKVDFTDSDTYHSVWTDTGEHYHASSIIIATGSAAKYLDLPTEKEFLNKGVSACAVCDGFFYKGKRVGVVGGGDTACEDAIYLSAICPEVYLFVRRNELRASSILQDRLKASQNIKVLWNTEIVEMLGDHELKRVLVTNNITGAEAEMKLDGIFIAIGHSPATGIFEGHLDLDEQGYIVTGQDSTQTSVKGVFACGDVMDKVYRQAITAAGTGCMAALDCERFLSRYLT